MTKQPVNGVPKSCKICATCKNMYPLEDDYGDLLSVVGCELEVNFIGDEYRWFNSSCSKWEMKNG